MSAPVWLHVKAGKRTADQCQLCPPQDGIQIEVGHIEAVHGC
jgi:hypothetical protein